MRHWTASMAGMHPMPISAQDATAVALAHGIDPADFFSVIAAADQLYQEELNRRIGQKNGTR